MKKNAWIVLEWMVIAGLIVGLATLGHAGEADGELCGTDDSGTSPALEIPTAD